VDGKGVQRGIGEVPASAFEPLLPDPGRHRGVAGAEQPVKVTERYVVGVGDGLRGQGRIT
jgi:hypothetical protein